MNPKRKKDAELQFIIADCEKAISANPLGHKTEKYLATARACEKELHNRQMIRSLREDRGLCNDLLKEPATKWWTSGKRKEGIIASRVNNNDRKNLPNWNYHRRDYEKYRNAIFWLNYRGESAYIKD